MKIERYRFADPRWDDPVVKKDMGILPGANIGWQRGDHALLFHTTSQANAEQILQEGFQPSPAIEVGGHSVMGVAGRMMPSGIWASIRPTVPHCVDIWMPHICDEPWAVLMILAPMDILSDRYLFEPTWPVCQFCLQPGDIRSVGLMEPADLPRLLAPELLQWMSQKREEHYASSPYLDAIDDAFAALAVASTR